MRMDDLIQAAVDDAEGIVNFSVLAEKLVITVRETEPQTVEEWLTNHAPSCVCHQMKQLNNRARARSVKQQKARTFGDSTKWWEEHGEGDLSGYSVLYVVDDEDNRIRVADMTGKHHKFVAEKYQGSAEQFAMLAAFHRAVARKVGDKKTSDVLSEQEYERLRDSILKRMSGEAA